MNGLATCKAQNDRTIVYQFLFLARRVDMADSVSIAMRANISIHHHPRFSCDGRSADTTVQYFFNATCAFPLASSSAQWRDGLVSGIK